MDHSDGIEVARGLLPSVTVLKPGLALCLKHSQVDKRFIDSHIEQLDQNLPKELYAAFIAKDTTNGQLAHVIEMLQRYRGAAVRENRVYFIYSPYFAARLTALMEEVDHLFYYMPGLSAPLLLTEKLNGKRIPFQEQEILILKREPKRHEERKVLHLTLPAGVSSDEASRLISEALAAKYSGQIDIVEEKPHAP